MKELGLKAYRFSFCWARIMPDGHHVNQEGLEFYDQIIQLCLEMILNRFQHFII